MAIATQMTVEQYLRTSFRPDCEYVDGEVLDRNVGEVDHGWVQRAILFYVMQREKELGVVILQEQRLRINSQHYRVPDLMIFASSGKPKEQIITSPPIVCVEVLSPKDRMSRMRLKVADYLDFGVRYVWVLDPRKKLALIFTAAGGERIADDALRTENPAIEVPLNVIFDEISDQL